MGWEAWPHTHLGGPAVPRAGRRGEWVEGIDGNEITWAGRGGVVGLQWSGSGLMGEKRSVVEKRRVVVRWTVGVRTCLVGYCQALGPVC